MFKSRRKCKLRDRPTEVVHMLQNVSVNTVVSCKNILKSYKCHLDLVLDLACTILTHNYDLTPTTKF